MSSAARPPRARTLRTHLVLLALALLLPALGLGLAVAWHAVEAYRSAYQARLQDTARALALALDREIGTFIATLEGLAVSPRLDAGATPEDLADFRATALEIAAARGSWIALAGPGPEYRTQMHTLVPPGAPLGGGLRLPAPDAPLPRVFATGQPAVGGIAPGRASGRPTAFVFVPVRRDGQVIRALGMALDPERLAGLLAAQLAGGVAFAAVVDARGNVAARSRGHEHFLGRPAPAWYVAQAAGRTGGFLQGGSGLDAQRVVLGFASLAVAPGWSVALIEPWSAYAASWVQPLQALALGGAVVLALGLVAAWRLSASLLRPLRALAGDAAAVAAAGRSEGLPAPAAPPSSVLEFEALRRDIAAADTALRDRAEAARASEARLRLAVEGTGMATWDLDLRSGQIIWSRHHFLMLGLDPDSAAAASIDAWRGLVLPDDLIRVETAWQRAEREGSLFHVAYRIRRADDGRLRWIDSYGRFVRAPSGEDGAPGAPSAAGRFVGVMFDVTERRGAEEQQRMLMREVDHRAKNILAVVQSVLRLTRAEDPRAFAAAVEGRVLALARAHELLARDNWHGAGLREVIEQELAPYRGVPARIVLDGPRLRLPADAVQPLGMVVHELATNAAKYGALSVPQGRLRVAWRRAPDGTLHLHWEERGGPALRGAPGRRGFGSRLIASTVQGQLGGKVDFAWHEAGLVCGIALPAERLGDAERGEPEPVGADRA
jgi:two-component sensor histidine kinase